MYGKVSLVGAGSGDPELLTLRAYRLIKEAQAVVYDNLVGHEVVALISPSARTVYAGKEAGRHALPQERINELLVELARQGLHVVRLKGGDPFIFGRGGEEMAALEAAGIPFEIVPGVTTASAVGAYTGVPMTHRSYACSLVLTTGHLKDGSLDLDWDVLARERQTLVVYMGLAALPKVCSQLIAHGLPADTPGLVVQSATTREQRSVAAPISSLAEKVAAAGLQSPALIVIGAVAGTYCAQREAALLAARYGALHGEDIAEMAAVLAPPAPRFDCAASPA
ncbi:uroporphyrinogen-III C-methyltransferase [Azonexus sp.]|uniref:uroporphyrinogen-III C-methyltransferase n=1 Tax=Azonexus sp. TaxID=1872668 RepID=UPI0039E2E518